MRDSIGATWIFTIVITFTLIFAGFLVLSLNYAKIYKLKNELTTIIEKYEGITYTRSITTKSGTVKKTGSINIINQYLTNAGYSAKGSCQLDTKYNKVYGCNDLVDGEMQEINEGNETEKFYYCISYYVDKTCDTFFKVTLFYDFNLPVLGQLKKYAISGQTNEMGFAYSDNNVITTQNISYCK